MYMQYMFSIIIPTGDPEGVNWLNSKLNQRQLNEWIMGNGFENVTLPFTPSTFTTAEAALYIARNMRRVLTDAPASWRVSSMNLWETESKAAE